MHDQIHGLPVASEAVTPAEARPGAAAVKPDQGPGDAEPSPVGNEVAALYKATKKGLRKAP